jgi:thioredoxin 1
MVAVCAAADNGNPRILPALITIRPIRKRGKDLGIDIGGFAAYVNPIFFKCNLCHPTASNSKENIDGEMKMKISEPIHVNDAAFEKVVLKSSLPVVVDFWAPWCGPCRMVAPTLDKIAKENAGKLVVAKVNTDENAEWAMKYGVQGIPTMLFIANGKVMHRQVGALPEPALRTVLDRFLQTAVSTN